MERGDTGNLFGVSPEENLKLYLELFEERFILRLSENDTQHEQLWKFLDRSETSMTSRISSLEEVCKSVSETITRISDTTERSLRAELETHSSSWKRILEVIFILALGALGVLWTMYMSNEKDIESILDRITTIEKNVDHLEHSPGVVGRSSP